MSFFDKIDNVTYVNSFKQFLHRGSSEIFVANTFAWALYHVEEIWHTARHTVELPPTQTHGTNRHNNSTMYISCYVPFTINTLSFSQSSDRTKKTERTDRAWFSRLVRHPATKWSRSILTPRNPHGARHANDINVQCSLMNTWRWSLYTTAT